MSHRSGITQDQKDLAISLKWKGYSVGQIAAEIGVTRNTIMGHLYRSGLCEKKVSVSVPKPKPKPVVTVSKSTTNATDENLLPLKFRPLRRSILLYCHR